MPVHYKIIICLVGTILINVVTTALTALLEKQWSGGIIKW